MTNYKTRIKDIKFDKDTPKALEESGFYNEWPVVYILNNKKEMYIGETYHSAERMKQHLKNPRRQRLNEAHIIGCDEFTKSATLDVESSLIELCSSLTENRRELQNENNGLGKHQYANKDEFKQDSKFFEHLWKQLIDRGLVSGSIENLKNTDLFKYSPYKSLNAEQCTTRDYIIEDIAEALVNDENRTIFVNGSAGTGKTILAIYLMKLLVTNANYFTEEDDSEILPFIEDLKKIRKIKSNLEIAYVVSMSSFRNTLKKVFKSVNGLKPSMVIGPNELAKKHYDILLVDEAHRLKKRRNIVNYRDFDNTNKVLGFTCNGNENDGNELDWILKQSQIQILFYDPSQSVKPTDVDKKCFDSINNIKYTHNLTSQMRCMSGRDYIYYIDNILNCRQEKYVDFSKDYDFKLFNDINDFCNAIKQKESEAGLARIVSGYGFEWNSKKTNEPDIVIGNKEFFWNRTSNGWPLTIQGDKVIEEVGCIHTIQGYDLNYCGVIFSPEIIFRNGQITVDKNKYYDQNGKNGITNTEELKQYIINIYKVLMSRGIKGTYVYVCDKGLKEYLKKYISEE